MLPRTGEVVRIDHGPAHDMLILRRPDGRTALLDYGITGRLSEVRRLAFLRLMMGAVAFVLLLRSYGRLLLRVQELEQTLAGAGAGLVGEVGVTIDRGGSDEETVR